MLFLVLRSAVKCMNQGRGIRMTWEWRYSLKQVVREFFSEEVAFAWRPE